MKTKQAIITTAAIIALAVIGATVLVLLEPGTATVPTDETTAVKKVAPQKPVKKTSVKVHVKPAETLPAKAAKPTRLESIGTVVRGSEGDVEMALRENAVETPKAENVNAEKKIDNPFPRYLDMFKNNPEALAAEFQKEAEVDRASLAKMREAAIEALKLNAEQVAMFEKALDDLRGEVTRTNEEWVELIKSGQLNDEDDGSILTSNRLLGERFVAACQKAFRETAEKLYEQLELDGVSDAKKQAWLYIATSRTASSYECLEPVLAVYDKVYKNYGIGDGIFSWNRWHRRQQQKEQK